MSAIRPYFWLANGRNPFTSAFTHSAPSLVFPAPRPPRTSQMSRSLPPAGYCAIRAVPTHSRSTFAAIGAERCLAAQGSSELASELNDTGVHEGECGGQFCIVFLFFLG